jgi:hypothetical protein
MHSQNYGFTDEIRLKSFQNMIISTHGDAAESARFNSEVDTPQALVGYAAARGVDISESEARTVFEAAQDFVVTQTAAAGGEVRLDDAELGTVNGGVSWAAVGGTICGIAGAVAGVAIAVATAPVSIALGTVAGTVALVGTAVVGGAGTAFSGAVTGALAGGASQLIHDKITG